MITGSAILRLVIPVHAVVLRHTRYAEQRQKHQHDLSVSAATLQL